MQRLIIFLLVNTLCGTTCLVQAQPSKMRKITHTSRQTYQVALYLLQYIPRQLPLIETEDTTQFLISKEWLKMVDTFLKHAAAHNDTIQSDFFHFPADDSPVGLNLRFRSVESKEAWLKLPIVQKMMRAAHMQTTAPHFSYIPDHSTLYLGLTSDDPINWLVVAEWISHHFMQDMEYYSMDKRVMEGDMSEYYDSKPCADKCADNFLVFNEGAISWGYTASQMNWGWENIGWTKTYDLKKHTIQTTFRKTLND